MVQGFIALQSWIGGPPRIFTTPPTHDLRTPEVRAEVNEEPMLDYIRRIYEPNLRRLITEHQKRDEQAIFVTQTTRPSMFRVEGNVVWAHDPASAGYGVALRLINSATKAVCNQNAAVCRVIDLASEISFEDD